MPDNIVYNNDNYLVRTSENSIIIEGVMYNVHYEVVNINTDVVEFRTPVMPEAYRVAVQCDIALSQEHHLWPYKAIGEEGESGEELSKVLQ